MRIGLIGTFYFIGILTTIILDPWLADKYGRKVNVILNFIVFLLAVIGIMASSQIELLYFYMFVCGATYAGRVIVGINFLLEFITERWKQFVNVLKMLLHSVTIIFYVLLFEFATKKWLLIASVFFVLAFIGVLYIAIVVPESPLWLFGNKLYQMSRENLKEVAHFNSVY